jgi:ATP-binding cassette subfamily D (ALD) long-chain fatty acid import protein
VKYPLYTRKKAINKCHIVLYFLFYFILFFSLFLIIYKMQTFSKPVDTFSWLRNNKALTTSLFTACIVLLYTKRQKKHDTQQEKTDTELFPVIDFNQKVGVNEEFRRQLHSIATILFPSWKTKEAALLVLHSLFLIARTYLSVVVARLDGRIVRDLVREQIRYIYIQCI